MITADWLLSYTYYTWLTQLMLCKCLFIIKTWTLYDWF